jgi:glutamate--cysteine ligase
MMKRTCTTQVNLDYSSEADMIKKMRVSMVFQPIVAAIFANSDIVEGKLCGKAHRARVWQNTDPARSGLLPFVFDEGFGFERYVDYLLDVPMYFVKRNGTYIDVAGASFRDFMQGNLAELPGECATMYDVEDQISIAFPEVRLKRYLELRGADSGSLDHTMRLTKFWLKMLYNPAALNAAYEIISSWPFSALQDLYLKVPDHGRDAEFFGQRAEEWYNFFDGSKSQAI